MKLYLKEGEEYSEHELEKLLKKSGIEDTTNFIKNSLSSRIFLPKIKKTKFNVSQDNIKPNSYKVNFVGILKYGSTIVLGYPKYINNIASDISDNHNKFKRILKVIEKSYSENIFSEYSSLDNSSTLFNLIIKLWQEFMSYGIYSNQIETTDYNGEGEILWEETISQQVSFVFNDIPVYLDTFTKSSEDENDNIARQIHLSILSNIQNEISIIFDVLGYEQQYFQSIELSDIGEDSYLLRALERELGRQNITFKQNILNNLIDYIEKRGIQSSNEKIELYGTTSFNIVWENICKKVYEDHLPDRISALELKISGDIKEKNGSIKQIDYTDRERLSDIVDKPVWEVLINNKKIFAKSGAQLDVLHINHTEKSFDIYDGKYYKIKVDERNIVGQPGMEDIIKQYFYQLAYKNIAEINDYKFNNYFVVPVDNLTYDMGNGVHLYKVSISYLSELQLNDIIVIGRDCDMFFKEYLGL